MKKLWKKSAAILSTVILAASLGGCGSKESSNKESKEELVVVTWGGELETALKKSVADFEAENNCTITWQSATDYAKLKSMVDSGDVQWDVVTVDPDFVYRGSDQGLLEKLDYNVISTDGLEGKYSDYGVGAYTWATVIAYNTDKFSGSNVPSTWTDFWNTGKYSGERTLYKSPLVTLEIALLADGVNIDDVYPLDVDRAFKSLDKIKGSVSTWWESGAQPQQMLSSQQVDLAQAWAGRITSAKAEGASVDIVYNQAVITTDQWVVPKGTKHKELAMKFLNAITSAEAGKTFSENITYGPANDNAYDLLSDDIINALPSAPKYADQVLVYDAEYWAENYDSVLEKFNSWLLK